MFHDTKKYIKYTIPTAEFQNHLNTERELSEVTLYGLLQIGCPDFAMESGEIRMTIQM